MNAALPMARNLIALCSAVSVFGAGEDFPGPRWPLSSSVAMAPWRVTPRRHHSTRRHPIRSKGYHRVVCLCLYVLCVLRSNARSSTQTSNRSAQFHGPKTPLPLSYRWVPTCSIQFQANQCDWSNHSYFVCWDCA